MEKITLIYNNPNPKGGGIPRYAYELSKRIKAKHIDTTPVYGKNIINKFINVIYRRKMFFIKNSYKFSEINHFLQPEIFYNTKKGVKIVTVHDLVILYGFFDVHNFYELGRKILLTKRFKESLKNADFFIANSEQTRNELEEFGIESDKIEVINLGVDKKFEIIKSFEERENNIGYLGSFIARKRVDKLIKDFVKNMDKDFKLILGGGGRESKNLFKKYGRFKNVIFKGFIPEERIVDFYNSLKAFAFPTKYEGFGLPIIEAVACGTPCFIYKDAKISEEVKKYAIEIESVDEIPSKLEEINENWLRKMSKKVKKEFDWDKTAENTMKVYRRFL